MSTSIVDGHVSVDVTHEDGSHEELALINTPHCSLAELGGFVPQAEGDYGECELSHE